MKQFKLFFISFLLIFGPIGLHSSTAVSNECFNLVDTFIKIKSIKLSGLKTRKNSFDITKYGLDDTPLNHKKFKRLYRQCTSADDNSVKQLASARFSKFNKIIDISTTIGGYTQASWNVPKDTEWFFRLGYSIVFGEVVNKIQKDLIVGPKGKFSKLIHNYIFGRAAITSYIIGYTTLFDAYPESKKKLEEIQSSPKFKEEIEKLKKHIENKNLINRYQAELIVHLKELKEISLGIGVHDGVDFDHLTPKDLNNEDIQKVVIAAIIAEEYTQRNQLLNVTGDWFQDLFILDSLYSIAKIPKDIFLNKIVNRIMCLNSHNIVRGVSLASGVTILDQIVFSNYYGLTYTYLRDHLIN